MATNPLLKGLDVKFDWILISPIKIKSRLEKKSVSSDIVIVSGQTPKNILEQEQQAMEATLTYQNMPEKFPEIWDEHPAQGIIVGLGPKVDPEEKHKVGDKVYYQANTGEPMIVKKQFYSVIKAYNIYCKVPK